MILSLAGKRVLVTGGAIRGGSFICRAFAAAGAEVIIHCRNSRQEADLLCFDLGGKKAGHRVYVCDLANSDAADAMIRETAPDILVNNAASYFRAGIRTEEAADAFRQYQINFEAPCRMIRTLADVRGEQDTAVVNILDCNIKRTDPDSFSYALSKKMLAAATRAAALQCGPFLRVNAVAPGNMIPPENLKHLNMRSTIARLPLKRTADPADVAESVLFLARCTSVTGTILYVDAGQSLLGTPEEEI